MKGVTTFPPFTLSHAYLGLFFPNPHSYSLFRQPRHPPFHHHASLLRHLPTWLPFIVILDSDSLCLPSYLPISDILYDTQTRCGRPFPGLSCI